MQLGCRRPMGTWFQVPKAIASKECCPSSLSAEGMFII